MTPISLTLLDGASSISNVVATSWSDFWEYPINARWSRSRVSDGSISPGRRKFVAANWRKISCEIEIVFHGMDRVEYLRKGVVGSEDSVLKSRRVLGELLEEDLDEAMPPFD